MRYIIEIIYCVDIFLYILYIGKATNIQRQHVEWYANQHIQSYLGTSFSLAGGDVVYMYMYIYHI